MKKIIVALFVLFSAESQAQHFNYISCYADLGKYDVVDSASLKYTYKLTYVKDTLKPGEKSTDLQVLLIGKTVSKYYSQYALDYNAFVVAYLKKHDDYLNTKQEGAWSYEVFKNYPKGKETVTDIASMLGGFSGISYMYEETLPVFDWKISGEKQVILSYNCQKATASFRGRTFVAWFAVDIPVPNGPWKFGGLPGLILKISDTKKQFSYECVGLEQLKKKEPIKLYQIEYTKLNRKDLYRLYKRFHDDFAAYNNSLGNKVREMDDKTGKSKYVEHSSKKIPYNPIELE